MELLQETSFILLSQESVEVKQIIYQLVNSRFKQQDQLNISILPFLSSICDGWLTFFKSQNIEIEIPSIENVPFDRLVKSTRVSYKLYSDKKHNKISSQLQKDGLKRMDLLQTDYNFIQKLVVKLLGQKDLGVFTIDGSPYGNTSQLNIYLDKILNIKSTASLSDLEKNSFLFLTKYSEYIASFINSVVTQTSNSSIDENKSLSLDSNKFEHKDYFFYDEQRKNLLSGVLPKDAQLFLFNIFCQNNFINDVIPDVFQISGPFFYRSKLQTYLISINCLSLILKKHSRSINESQFHTIQHLLEEKEKYFTFENKLRNNIFHYGIQEIPVSIFKDSKHHFEEMIEYSVDIDFERFMAKINQSFTIMNQMLSDLIKYKL
ncbi:hypothetical protein FPV21_00420 [Carnobacterium sp. PL12RED10]|uniref:hypothetical protein n=1 Tax=unclassified Carnobacterium TaxID=257487 RepID=UPI00080A8623|nr:MULTISPECIES: hypothetical protein [unclassified Carnobacterium]KAF3302731.1 hypothetical protein FPV21_00420 [Carnobacterium sp. PL12RED10]